ncbi:hypothetical protein [Actinacidiphila sp. bgisy167]|uniref:hypothetical protein n=1 Tax=Actinacidiphila sp. bgisy167 TaxID=3413797 RepID=UPI003D717317
MVLPALGGRQVRATAYTVEDAVRHRGAQRGARQDAGAGAGAGRPGRVSALTAMAVPTDAAADRTVLGHRASTPAGAAVRR